MRGGTRSDDGQREIVTRALPTRVRLGEVLMDGSAGAARVAILVGTLEVHLAHGRVISRTADVLGIHRSTVRYRLFRSRELTGLDPDGPGALPSLRQLGGTGDHDPEEPR
jgi:hypothetical protein